MNIELMDRRAEVPALLPKKTEKGEQHESCPALLPMKVDW
jgi:hypothetical protein